MFDSIGRYAIEEQVAEGGTSTIFRAYDKDRRRVVALKLLAPELFATQGEGLVEALRRGAEGASVLSHPNISRVMDVGQEAEFAFVCTDFVEGVSAFEVVQRYGPLPFPLAVRLVADVLSGLEYAHENGLLHGDVKLENVMLANDGRGVLTDYGLAKESWVRSDGEASPSVSASAPPERILGASQDARSDLYGVGIVLFEVMTGEAAFPTTAGDDPWEVARRRVEEPPPSLTRHLPETPDSVDRVLARSLARDPAARYASAAEMQRALLAAARELGLTVPDRLEVRTLERDVEEARRQVERAFRRRGRPATSPGRSGAPRGAGWLSVCLPVGMVLLLAGGFLREVAYLSVSTFPPEAEVLLVSGDSPGVVRHLGHAPVTFRRIGAGKATLVLRWQDPEDPAAPPVERRVEALELRPRSHLQVDAGLLGVPSVRTVRLLLAPWERLQDLLSPPRPRFSSTADAVDTVGDRHLAQGELEAALEVYRARIQEHPEVARKAADRLVEAALFLRPTDAGAARNHLEKALDLDADHAHGHAILAELLAEAGQGDPLLHFRKAAQRLLPLPENLPKEPRRALDLVRASRVDRPDDDGLRAQEAFLLARVGLAKESLAMYRSLAAERGWTTRYR